ncbi:Uncharacterised protein [Providencia alcalifaciens]|nr:Uncharacterised protein [Providencia alcalifaciens]
MGKQLVNIGKWFISNIQPILFVLLLAACVIYNLRINNLETENESLTSQLSASQLLNKVTPISYHSSLSSFTQ